MGNTVGGVPSKKRAKRDPEARRAAIAKAAAEILVAEGSERLTHRRVAQKADVALGSTTQYFSSIDDLRRAGYEVIAREIEKDYEAMRLRIEQANGDLRILASCMAAYLRNKEEVYGDLAFYWAAARDPELARLANHGFETLIGGLRGYLTDDQMAAIAILCDGAFVEVGIFGNELDEKFLYRMLSALAKI